MGNAITAPSGHFGLGAIDIASALGAAVPFRNLPTRILAEIAKFAEARHYRAGEVIFTAGQYDGSEFFLIAEGSLHVSHAAAESGSMVVDHAYPGAVVGLAAAVAGAGQEQSESITFMTDSGVTLIAIDSGVFRRLVARRPSLSRTLAAHFAEALSTTQLGSPGMQGAAEQRIFAALLAHVERDSVSGEWRIAKMPKHKELADRADTDESTAAAAIARLIHDGAAKRDYPGLVIIDIPHLRRLAS